MTHDPMLDGITRWDLLPVQHDFITTYDEGRFVLFSDLPALIARVREDERGKEDAAFRIAAPLIEQRGYEQGQRDERERHANELDVAVAKARAEVVTVNLEGDFNYVKGYNDGLIEGDAKGRREGKRIASMRGESDG